MKKLLSLDSPMDCPYRDNSCCHKLPMIALTNGEKEDYECGGNEFPAHCPLADSDMVFDAAIRWKSFPAHSEMVTSPDGRTIRFSGASSAFTPTDVVLSGCGRFRVLHWA